MEYWSFINSFSYKKIFIFEKGKNQDNTIIAKSIKCKVTLIKLSYYLLFFHCFFFSFFLNVVLVFNTKKLL